MTLFETPATTTITSGTSIADSNNRFSAALYRTITNGDTNTGDNVFFSPFSISSALAITYEGARGTTAEEIRSVFFFPSNETVLRQGFAVTNAAINQGNAGYTLSTANALWAEKTFAFLPDYTSIAEQYYSANTTNLDFIGQADASRQTINAWVAERTNNKILNLLPQGSISPATRLVITNAVYFKGTWEKQFDPNLTTNAPFTKPDGTIVTASMMQQTDEAAVYPYTETSDLQMLTLPYTATNGTGLSMVILLPKGNNLSTIDSYLDPANLSALEQSASSRRVMVYIPRFKIESQYSLKDTLSTMGMPTAFSTTADFSGMDGKQDLYISDVIHKAYIEVNEQGT
ncbi:MAG: serpin family protein, partial [Methanoregula sp.]